MRSRDNLLFPEPTRLFISLMRLWDTFSTSKRFGRKELQAYKGWLERHVGVTEHSLRTVMAEMGRKKAVGFQGRATYEVDAEDGWSRGTDTLARFGEYSNLGGNRTGGFGETGFVSG